MAIYMCFQQHSQLLLVRVFSQGSELAGYHCVHLPHEGRVRGVRPVQGPNTCGGSGEGELQRGRQGLLPDFKLEISSPAGEPEYRLAELKILELKMIGAVSKCYPRSGNLARIKRAVERRVVSLPGEYSKPMDHV